MERWIEEAAEKARVVLDWAQNLHDQGLPVVEDHGAELALTMPLANSVLRLVERVKQLECEAKVADRDIPARFGRLAWRLAALEDAIPFVTDGRFTADEALTMYAERED